MARIDEASDARSMDKPKSRRESEARADRRVSRSKAPKREFVDPEELDEAVLYLIQVAVERLEGPFFSDADILGSLPERQAADDLLRKIVRQIIDHRDKRTLLVQRLRAVDLADALMDRVESAETVDDDLRKQLTNEVRDACDSLNLPMLDAAEIVGIACRFTRGYSPRETLNLAIADAIPGLSPSTQDNFRDAKHGKKAAGAVKSPGAFSSLTVDTPPPQEALRRYVEGLLLRMDKFTPGFLRPSEPEQMGSDDANVPVRDAPSEAGTGRDGSPRS